MSGSPVGCQYSGHTWKSTVFADTHRVLAPLRLLDTRFAIFRLPPGEQPPYLAGLRGELVMVTRTADEVTVICPEPELPPQVQAEHDWRALKVEAPFELASAVGVLTALTGPIAAAGIAIFAISTWATDYILVRNDRLPEAIAALRQAGHAVNARELRPPDHS